MPLFRPGRYDRLMAPTATPGTLRLASSVSALPDGLKAAGAVAAQCNEVMGDGPIDLAMLFLTAEHLGSAEAIARRVREELRATCLIGISAQGVVGGRLELERTPGVSILAARLPGVEVVPFTGDDLMPLADDSPEGLARCGRAFGASESLRASIIFADPFSSPVGRVVTTMNRARAEGRIGAILGGVASAGTAHGTNALILNERVSRAGLVGVSLKGPVCVDTVVSQGCRGFGPTFVVTAASKNVVLKLGGKPALDAVRELVEGMSDSDRKLLERGLFLGRVVDEYKDRFGRDDFLVRNVVGVEESQGALAVNDVVPVGTTVRFHLRDAESADQDLAMLLDAQKLREPPVGGLLITCNGRGEQFFGRPNHDATAIVRAFAPTPPGEEMARGGADLQPDRPGGSFPLAGFFGAGEIGPVGVDSHVHGFTACLALFRADR